jgi:hypothetical protein
LVVIGRVFGATVVVGLVGRGLVAGAWWRAEGMALPHPTEAVPITVMAKSRVNQRRTLRC